MSNRAIQYRHLFCSMNDKDEYIATCYVERRHSTLWLTALWVQGEHRKQGLGSRMLQMAVDELGASDIYLNVGAYTDQPLSDTQLITWYQRFGFESTAIPGVMLRRGSNE